MKLKFFLLAFLVVSSCIPLVASSPDFVIVPNDSYDGWIEPGNFITFNQFKLRLVEIIPAEKEANMSVTVELLEDDKRLMYDILKYNETVTPHSDIKIQFNSVYTSQNLKMAKLTVWYKNEDQYVGRSWSDISDTVPQDQLALLRSGGTASVIMITGGSTWEETLILQNLGSKQVNNLVVTFSFPEDESYGNEFSCILPKTFIGAGESMSVILSYIPSKNPPKQIRGSIKIGNSVMPSTLPIYINASSGQITGGSDPFGGDPFGGGSSQQTNIRMYHGGTHLVAGSVNVNPGDRLIYYSFSLVSFTLMGAPMESMTGIYEGKSIYYVVVPTTVNGTFNVGVGSQSYSVVVGSTAPRYEKGLSIVLEPIKETYKANDKVKVTVKTTDGLIVDEVSVTAQFGNMSYNVKSGSTITIPETDVDVYQVDFSATYPNYGSAKQTIFVNNEMSPLVAIGLLLGFFGIPIAIIVGLIMLWKSRRNVVNSGPDTSVLKDGIGTLD